MTTTGGSIVKLQKRPWLNWIERLTTDQKAPGSTPGGRATYENPAVLELQGFYFLNIKHFLNRFALNFFTNKKAPDRSRGHLKGGV